MFLQKFLFIPYLFGQTRIEHSKSVVLIVNPYLCFQEFSHVLYSFFVEHPLNKNYAKLEKILRRTLQRNYYSMDIKKSGVIKSTLEVIFGLLQKRKFQIISASDFFAMIKTEKNITIIDCRDKDDYAQDHVDKAINIPYQIFMKNYQNIPKKKTVVTICYLGIYGRAAAQKIASSGNYTVYTVMGGMRAIDKLKE